MANSSNMRWKSFNEIPHGCSHLTTFISSSVTKYINFYGMSIVLCFHDVL